MSFPYRSCISIGEDGCNFGHGNSGVLGQRHKPTPTLCVCVCRVLSCAAVRYAVGFHVSSHVQIALDELAITVIPSVFLLRDVFGSGASQKGKASSTCEQYSKKATCPKRLYLPILGEVSNDVDSCLLACLLLVHREGKKSTNGEIRITICNLFPSHLFDNFL